MTDAVRTLVEAAMRAAGTLRWATGCGGRCSDGSATILPAKCADAAHFLGAGIRAVGEDDTAEYALARAALEAVRYEAMKDALADDISGVQPRYQKVLIGRVTDEINHQLSLLGCPAYEVVAIPQGETCEGCMWAPLCNEVLCHAPGVPDGERSLAQGTGEHRRVEWYRSLWCRSRYGVKA